ncbi:MAG: hypothetical protein RL291_797 [Pseudomonadota bacterium]
MVAKVVHGSRLASSFAARDRRLRQQRYRAGLWAEILAMALLVLTGHRILGWRCRTGYGEIDIVAKRGLRLAFVEVKQRRSVDAFDCAITPRQAQRFERAVDHWLARRPTLAARSDVSLDAVWIMPWGWPRIARNHLARHTAG